MDGLEKLNRQQLEDCVKVLLGGSLKIRGFNAQKKQLKDIIEFLEDNSLVEGIEDSKDKTFDRLKGFLDDMPDYFAKLDKMGESILPIDMKSLESVTDSDIRANIMIDD